VLLAVSTVNVVLGVWRPRRIWSAGLEAATKRSEPVS